MNNIFQSVRTAFGSMGKHSRLIFRLGAALITALAVSSLVLYISAGRIIEYYTAIAVSEQLFACIRPCAGVIVIGILLFEGTKKYVTDDES